MKLALIRRQYSATGGAELYLDRLMDALAGAGHAIHLFAEQWPQSSDRFVVHPIQVSGSRAERPLRFAAATQAALANERFDCVFSLERTLQQDVYRAGDGVHRVWLERRREFAPWWRKPFIGLGAFHRNLKRLEAQALSPQNTRRVIVNSEMVKREIIEHFRFPEERIHLVRNGVDVTRFQSGKRKETRARFGIKEDEFLLLFVGSGWERKGLRFLLDALAMKQTLHSLVSGIRQPEPAIWNMKLLVVGKGKRPSNPPADVIFTGPMADVENAYAAADLFVFLPIYEPSANVCFEAMAAGLPVITSAQNGASELVEDGVNGTVIPNPADIMDVHLTIDSWYRPHFQRVNVDSQELSLERNVSETLAVLEIAAREKRQ